MTTKDMAEVMLAYASGKQIQHKIFCKNFWVDDDEPEWDWVRNNYRIKPEEPKDEYRPFRDVSELITYWEKHYMQTKVPANAMPVIWVKSNRSPAKYVVTGFIENLVVLTGQLTCSMTDLFDKWEFLDGKPCGVDMSKKDCVTCKHNDDGTADPLNGLCVNCEGFNNWEKDA